MHYTDLADEVASARRRILDRVVCTPLMHSLQYSQRLGVNVYFKCENLQTTGSFKLRGATNKFLSLDSQQQQRGVVAASTGNHGRAVAHAARESKTGCTIFAPTIADQDKLNAMRSLGAEIVLTGSDCIDAEAAAREEASKSGRCYISPYNDSVVVAGQGTIGLELCEQLERIDAIFVAVGGGGLISGVGAAVKQQHPDCVHVGCSPTNSNVMIQSLAAGKILDLPSDPTLSDATAGGVETGSVTFEYCQQLVDRTISVSESDIERCLAEFIDMHDMLIEGAAAVAIAALEQLASEFAGKNVVVILCGGNISEEKLAAIRY